MSSASNRLPEPRQYRVLFLAIMLCCFLLGRHSARERIVHTQTETVRTDTITVRDTIRVESPAETRTEYVKEQILVPVRDTLWKHDTCYVSLPLEKRTYKREEFYAEVTGYEPRLTYIEVYPQTTTITQTEKAARRTRWGVGVQVGYGIGTHAGVVYTTPYVGVGISYNLFSF